MLDCETSLSWASVREGGGRGGEDRAAEIKEGKSTYLWREGGRQPVRQEEGKRKSN